MGEIVTAFGTALGLLVRFDASLTEIVQLSLAVSLSAVALASLIGLPVGAIVAVHRFAGRRAVIVVLNALMGLPPVVVGLVVYLLLSRAGPLGALGMLFTPPAMVIAQSILIAPIIAALARQILEDAWHEYEEQLRSLGARPSRAMWTLLWDTRFALVTVVLAGLGRAAAEVGAVMIVKQSNTVAKLRLLHVERAARGLGIGKRLIDECILFSRTAGYQKITLWTQANLLAARHLYKTVGFTCVAQEPHHRFGKDLVAETWELAL